MALTRRRFLAMTGALAAVTGLPEHLVARALAEQPAPDALAAAAALTTLAQTLRPGTANALGYRPVVSAPGEPIVVREELAPAGAGRAATRRSLLCFLHLTDQHLLDCQSPARVEFTDRLEEGGDCNFIFIAAWRPQEAASARTADAMLRRARAIAVSPITGAPIATAVCTGDNTDNQQANELAAFLAVMDGGTVVMDSGDPTRYEGVQASGDLAYWHPDPAVADRYKTVLGFPDRPGFLEQALASFAAAGAGTPWFSAYGNHDGLVQGNAPPNLLFAGIATGPVKVVGPPPGNPCTLPEGPPPLGLPGGVVLAVTEDPERRFVSRQEWIQAHLDSPGLPSGHGFSAEDAAVGRGYYVADVAPAVRFVVLDTVNPGGAPDGSVGQRQLDWLEERLAEADAARRLVLLSSHHGPRSLTNPNALPVDVNDPTDPDVPRRLADEVLAVVRRHPCVVAWINGHTHEHLVRPQQTFWDVGTAAHIDWPAQARIIDLVDNGDGTLSLHGIVIDHDDEPLAAFARELSGNDPQAGFDTGTGEASDRNVELLVRHPFAQAPAPAPTPSRTPTPTPTVPPSAGGGGGTGAALPATGGGLTLGGALLIAGAAGISALRRGRPPPP